MLALTLALVVAADPSAAPVRALIDVPKARLLLLEVDQTPISTGTAKAAAAEVIVMVEGEATVQAGAFHQALQAGDALFSATGQPWIVTPSLSRRPGKLLLLETPRTGREWKAGAPISRSLGEGATYLIAGGKGAATILFDAEGVGSNAASHQRLSLAPGAAVPEHDHPQEVEILYVLSGETELTMGGKATVLRPGDSVLIPAATKHSAKVVSGGLMRAIQFYVPGGPEQRFKKAPEKGTQPEIAKHLFEDGRLQLKARRFLEARDVLTECVALAPEYAECHLALGSVLARLRRADEAYSHYQTFLKLAPTHASAEDVRKLIKDYEDQQSRKK